MAAPCWCDQSLCCGRLAARDKLAARAWGKDAERLNMSFSLWERHPIPALHNNGARAHIRVKTAVCDIVLPRGIPAADPRLAHSPASRLTLMPDTWVPG